MRWLSKLSGRECTRIAVLKKLSVTKIAATTRATATGMLTVPMKLAVMATIGEIVVTGAEDTEWLDTGGTK
ncbi:hypothetical protein EN962_07250 [Mesorhizobium sp. M7A.F.Ca.CA.001.09.2.1]|uniref:Uncharacterized protein n=2 Tax=Mesorhizobium ciceri TaxID=39645 RepID=E8TP30_MESCW|nr:MULTISPECIES: hypothetical protein [Mesorhizobium]RUY25790.1 hypothetical protein EN981_33410 [Mesorhizobium sp. M7A.F.Ca.CA.001.13.2.1]ADV15065.1 hypothetical protein Mesci_6059 [Mesorhizobium ciceri biovar biserrulae WSM1271]MDF3218511.1 hypothetical protein [Mesorhizobium ciceri]RUY64257.1 hypothetical protein EN980_25825 [Mesorhizobium sp. M7A.F.Ca.CA.001.13.1.1]RUY68954.1 hypothetical protein EN965_12665 [Mesorhizobium sp. M7A.F.Ca.CA.001.05.1.1]